MQCLLSKINLPIHKHLAIFDLYNNYVKLFRKVGCKDIIT